MRAESRPQPVPGMPEHHGSVRKLARGRGIDHEWRDCGDGCLLLDGSPWKTIRLIWTPNGDGDPVIRYGNESDYPASDREAVFAWAEWTFAGIRHVPWPHKPPSGPLLPGDLQWHFDWMWAPEATTPYSKAPHRYQGLGDGRILLTRSQAGTWRFLWLGHTGETLPVIRTGREQDYPADRSVARILGWAAAQPWGRQTTARPFEAARRAAERAVGTTPSS